MQVLEPLYYQAERVLNVNQRELAQLLGISTRTIQRWNARQADPSFLDYQKLAQAVFPKNAALAAQLAKAGGATLESLVPLARPAPLPAPGGPAPEYLVDSIVCVAAVAADLKPP